MTKFTIFTLIFFHLESISQIINSIGFLHFLFASNWFCPSKGCTKQNKQTNSVVFSPQANYTD
jgi:hypothetical protein